MLLSSRTFLPEKELAISRLFFVFSYTTLKLVPGIVTRNLAVQHFDDNFRSYTNESGHAQLGLLETATFFRLRSSSAKFRNHCFTPSLSTSNEPSSKAEKEPQGFVTLSAFSCGECSGQQASCGGGCPGPSAERTGAKLLEMRSAQQMTLMVECVECGGMDGEETLD